jgi:phenylpyruvate tautomerase PptA (4-oxalocrotonate tautomerase family)
MSSVAARHPPARRFVEPAMPLVRIDVVEPWTADEIQRLSDVVQQAVVETLDVRPRDRFQIIRQHPLAELIFDRAYLDIERTDRFVLIEVTLSAGRTTEAKERFYARVAEVLGSTLGIRSEDVAICLVENVRENGSFGRGEASYVVLPREQWR